VSWNTIATGTVVDAAMVEIDSFKPDLAGKIRISITIDTRFGSAKLSANVTREKVSEMCLIPGSLVKAIQDEDGELFVSSG